MKPWTGREILQDFSDLYEEPITDKHKDINKSSNELIYENTSEPNVVPNTSASKNTTALKTSLDQLKEQLKISFDQKRLERRKNMRSQKQNQMCSRKHRSVQLN
jgi:predicted outer membrane protein